MNEFLNVAKNLEIKEISKDVEFDDGNVSTEETELPESENENDIELLSEQRRNNNADKNTNRNNKRNSDSQLQRNVDGKFECVQCESQFAAKFNLIRHIQSIHEGVKYPCTECDYQAKQEGQLNTHILSKHQNIGRRYYACSRCDYQATQQHELKSHFDSKHMK